MEKTLPLSSHHVNVQFITPASIKDDNTFVIFLHEALGSIPQWRDFPHKICAELGLKGIVYERQGHGKSSEFSEARKSDYLHRYAYEELHEIITTVLPLDAKIILVGHSDGGTIALLYAARFPKRIQFVATMAAHVINEAETRAGIYPAIQAFKQGKLDGLRKFHGEKTNDLFYAWANTWLSDEFLEWNICSEIQNDVTPALILQGKNDQYGTEKQIAFILQHMKNARGEMLDNCKHHPHLEQMDLVIEKIKGAVLRS